PIALYIFNKKRDVLIDIEARYGVRVSIEGDDSLIAPDHRIDRVRGKAAPAEVARPISAESIRPRDLEVEAEPEAEPETEVEQTEANGEAVEGAAETNGEAGGGRRRRRRRRRDGDRRPQPEQTGIAAGEEGEPQEAEAEAGEEGEAAEAELAADATSGPERSEEHTT